ncbi:MAG: von Willebrand factor type A domain-containing protein [Halioglobus sp.]
MPIRKNVTTLTLALMATACADQYQHEPVVIEQSEIRAQTAPPLNDEAATAAHKQQITEYEAKEARSQPGPINAQNLPIAEVARPERLEQYSAVKAKPSHHGVAMAADAIGLYPSQSIDREHYLHYEESPVKLVVEDPVSTFSIDVDTASYANIRRMIVKEGRLPPSDAVRLEEMINYFGYEYPVPDNSEQPFSVRSELARAPWSDQHHLLQVGLKGFEPAAAQRPSSNLVFLVDVSGSMRSPDKLGLLKKSLGLLVNKMRDDDRISLVVYAGAAGTVLEPTSGADKAKIMNAINALEAGGSTHGSAGIEMAYALAAQHKIEGGINRVIIASDGDMNVGTVNLESLKDLIERKRKSGVALTTLGFGSGNYNYALMEQLADVGDGNAAYIDSLKEAQKVLVNEMQSTLLTIASDVKIQVEFNPEQVSEYRLIGYENRILNREDFTNDKVDAGDIGAGHTVTALYEIVLRQDNEGRIPALRYEKNKRPLEQSATATAQEIAFVKLRYKTPGTTKSIELSQAIAKNTLKDSIANSSTDLRFAASVAGFGQILKGGTYTDNWGYPEALTLARNSRGDDPHGYRSEFVHMIELAQSLSLGH